MDPSVPFRPWPHRFAVVTAAVTLLLIAVGGLVTNTGSALAVPDWPTTFGHNMFTYPPSEMVGGIFYEHSHRLLGSLVGMLTIGLCVTLWRYDSRRLLRVLGVVALIGVIAQGVLGGMRVVMLDHGLAVVHGCFAEAFFGLVVTIAVLTSRQWLSPVVFDGATAAGSVLLRDPRRLRPLALLLLPAVYTQLVLGAFVTHRGALVILHILGAGIVTVLACIMGAIVLSQPADNGAVKRPLTLLMALVGLQLSFGLGAYAWHFTKLAEAVPFSTGLVVLALHRVTGATIWATAIVTSLRILRLGVAVSPSVARVGMDPARDRAVA